MGPFGQYFWSMFLIGSGVVLIVKEIFRLNISTPKAIVGVFIISIGVALLLGSHQTKTKKNLIFNNGNMEVVSGQNEYNIIFSNGTIDLEKLSLEECKGKIKINTIFGSGTIKINPDRPIVIKMNGAFAKATAPDGSSVVFGDHVYKTESAEGQKVYLEIEINTVFGKTDIIEGGKF